MGLSLIPLLGVVTFGSSGQELPPPRASPCIRLSAGPAVLRACLSLTRVVPKPQGAAAGVDQTWTRRRIIGAIMLLTAIAWRPSDETAARPTPASTGI